MGYRSNFIVVDKEKMDKLMSFASIKEAYDYFCPDAKLDDGDDDDRYYDMQYNVEKVIFKDCRKYEIGKYYESQKVLEGYPEVSLLATEDTECVLGDAEMIKRAIIQEQEDITAYLEKFIKEFDVERIKGYLESKKMWTRVEYFANLDKSDFHVTGSWHREYEVFSLVSLYKSVKDEEVVVYTAG